MKNFDQWQKLNESPDNIKLQYEDEIGRPNAYRMRFTYNDGRGIAKPFAFKRSWEEPKKMTDELWVGDFDDGHGNAPFPIYNNSKGRLWYASNYDERFPNVISFWYLDRFEIEELQKMVEIIEKKVGHSLKDWYLEIYDMYNEDDYDNPRPAKLQPLYEYIGKGEKAKGGFGAEELWHLMKQDDPRRKIRKVPQGFGSKKVRKYKEFQKPFESKTHKMNNK